MSEKIISEDITRQLKNALVNYTIDKRIATKANDQDVLNFCNIHITKFCANVNKTGYLKPIMDLLEKERLETGEEFDKGHALNLTNAINSLRAETQASLLTSYGNDWVNASNEASASIADSALKENVMFIPNELLSEVNQNLTIKADLEEFEKEHDGIVAAQASINIFRFEDMQPQQDDTIPEQ